ncbi:MAG: serine hydrolase domain-containing protein [Acidimicrobiales bacterium]
MTDPIEVHGTCAPGYEAVRDQFAANFAQGLELGASACVTVGGEAVVDIWAGDRDLDGSPWERDTIVNVWSTTKTMAATSLLVLADRGELDLDAPIATYWPEFAANGKEAITTAQVMGHTAGLPGFSPAISVESLYDQDACAANLAAQAPWWEPGTMSGYHLITQGYLEAEVVRRITGRSIGTFFREEVAGPLGADFHIGLPESEEGRVGHVTPPADPLGVVAGMDPESIAVRAGTSCPVTGTEQTTRAWRAAEIPAAGGTGNARSVARVHAMLANGGTLDGVRIMSPEGVDRIFVEQCHQTDAVLGVRMRLGTGFGLMNDLVPLSSSPRSCFWGGWGGSICVVDVDAGVSVAYVMNKMAGGLVGDMRGALIVLSAFGALAAQG